MLLLVVWCRLHGQQDGTMPARVWPGLEGGHTAGHQGAGSPQQEGAGRMSCLVLPPLAWVGAVAVTPLVEPSSPVSLTVECGDEHVAVHVL